MDDAIFGTLLGVWVISMLWVSTRPWFKKNPAPGRVYTPIPISELDEHPYRARPAEPMLVSTKTPAAICEDDLVGATEIERVLVQALLDNFIGHLKAAVQHSKDGSPALSERVMKQAAHARDMLLATLTNIERRRNDPRSRAIEALDDIEARLKGAS